MASSNSNAPQERDPLPPIKFNDLADALLARIETLVPAWLPGGTRNGHEYVCASLQGGKGSSCSVNMTTGRWADFASDERGGDLVSLYAAAHGLSMGKAALHVARDEGLEDVAGVQRDAGHQRIQRPAPPPAPAKPRSDEGWRTVAPVPAHAPEPTFQHYARPASDIMRHSEYSVGGDLYGYVVRFATSDGGKDDLPYTWCESTKDGTSSWKWKQFDEPRPLYLPGHTLPTSAQTVIVVEGEKKADILQACLEAGAPGVYVVVGWPGGCKAWAKADWSWIKGSTVLLWPDCDSKREAPTVKELNACADEAEREALKLSKPYKPAHKQPGMAAMIGIGHHLVADHACTAQLLAIDGPGIKPDGWDAADAIATEGWDFERVLQFFGTAYALPAADGAAPAAGADAAKKIDSPVGTDAGDDGGAAASAGGADHGNGKPMPWWLACFHDPAKNRWNLSRKTIINALRYDERLAGVLGFNLLSNTMEARLDWPFPHGRKGKIVGSIDLLLGNWLSKEYGLPAISRQAIMEGMETVAYENPWHPIQEWLTGLEWDGISRIDKWLIHVIGENPETLAPDLKEYLTIVGRCWLVGMVKRVLEPGCKFDYCPVLEGPGGLRKSTMVETLASGPWYSDTPFEIGKGKESQEQVQGIWAYEMGELSQMGKSEITAIKAFITAKVDRYRPAYGRVIEEHPRQCVLVGTTNEATYLRDRTGNRRFWPIPVRHIIKIEWLEKYRAQLFAEAYTLYMQGVDCIPSRQDEERLFVPMQEARLVETAVTSELLYILNRESSTGVKGEGVNSLSDFVTLSQLAKALNVDAGKSNAGLESQIRSWMNQQGWEYKKKQINGVRGYGWERPKNWLADAQEDSPEGQDSPTPASAGASGMPVEYPDDAPF